MFAKNRCYVGPRIDHALGGDARHVHVVLCAQSHRQCHDYQHGDPRDPAGGTRVIDASSAHRTSEGWCYGFPELVGAERVADARRVSNPGCYPTGFLALVAPLVKAGLLPADWPFTVNAVSGFSGGGKPLIERFRSEGAPAFRAYGYDLAHKHLGEMQAHAGLDHPVIFAPSVVPAYRGMLVEVPLHLGAMVATPHADDLWAALADFYADARLVKVHGSAPVGELLLETGAEWDSVYSGMLTCAQLADTKPESLVRLAGTRQPGARYHHA